MECEKIKYFLQRDYLIVFNTRTLKVFKFKSKLKNILPSMLPERFSVVQKNIFFKETEKIENEEFKRYLQFLVYDEPYTLENPQRETLTISFPTIHKCNLKCKYCYANAGENYENDNKTMTKETIENIIAYTLNNIASEYKFLQISLVSGGEPLLNLDVIEKINEYIDRYNKDIKRKIFIASNMTLLNEKHIKFFDNIKPQIGISIDGPKEIHDSMRVYKDERGTYEVVVDNLKKLRNKSVIVKTKKPMFMTVITEKNLDLVKILKHHLELDATSIQMKIARGDNNKFGIKEDNVSSFVSAYQNLVYYMINEYKNKNLAPFLALINGNDTMGKMIKSIILLEPNCYRCGAGKDRFSFTANGDIYPCDNFVGIEEFKLGNIYQDGFIDSIKYYEYHVNNSEVCSSCWAKYLCSGDCYYNSYIRTGNLKNPDSCMCSFFKKLSEMIIILVAEMEEVDYEQYKKLKRLISIRERNNFIH